MFFYSEKPSKISRQHDQLPPTLYWNGDSVAILDQTKLPHREIYIQCRTYGQVAHAIRCMKIRGAPAIGVAAAMGIALGCLRTNAKNHARFQCRFEHICRSMEQTRPTAANLFWAIKRMRETAASCTGLPLEELKARLLAEALDICEEDIRTNQRIGSNGAGLIPQGATVMTHCNAGALATAGYGTALGVILAAWEKGNPLSVMVCETRPFLQGARLTTWELLRLGIPHTLIADSMAGYFMQKGHVQVVMVGADRIALNGDAANKIGTYPLSVLARENGIPFYVAAPLSSIDPSLQNGDEIPIEERNPEEVTHILGKRVSPRETPARNPAFDITPAKNITAIITERGIIRLPYDMALREIFDTACP